MSELFDLYKATGNEIFTKKLCEIAPYFSTIEPQFVHLRPDYAEVTMPNTKKVHNHLGTVHAIAMCNLAEIAGGLLTDVSIPETFHWIPIGINAKYLAKATTDLRAIAKGTDIDWHQPGDKNVVVKISDTNDLEVCRVSIIVKVSLKKGETTC